jgi:V-type H+-transporting ATPase subunit a
VGFGDLFIHQLIETIEFVLGTISNTASYLRLWALSLAHAQLATVFFSNLMKPALGVEAYIPKVIALWIAFTIFASVTFAILMVMDVLECFLHTVRLHWVEF